MMRLGQKLVAKTAALRAVVAVMFVALALFPLAQLSMVEAAVLEGASVAEHHTELPAAVDQHDQADGHHQISDQAADHHNTADSTCDVHCSVSPAVLVECPALPQFLRHCVEVVTVADLLPGEYAEFIRPPRA